MWLFKSSVLDIIENLLFSRLYKKKTVVIPKIEINENVILWLISVVPLNWNFVISCSYLHQCG